MSKTSSPSNNFLFYGDNLERMKELEKEKGAFIDLVYIDPPFNSKRDYNILYNDRYGEDKVQIEAFTDTWSNVRYSDNIDEIARLGLQFINDYLLFIKRAFPISYVSYLSMMAIRIYYIRELLKETGSFYLHCDPTMSHYLKTLCDFIFGVKNFKNEIVWSYRTGGVSKRHFPRKHDIILFYAKSNKYKHHPLKETLLYDAPFFTGKDINPNKEGKYPVEVYIRDVWEKGVKPIINTSKKRLGYPTQKPIELLDRIIKASSNKGDVVADFFCGCGTTIDSAIGLKRNFVGCDISTLSIGLIAKTLKERHTFLENKNYTMTGLPKSIEQAQLLADKNKFEFQDWVVAYLINGFPNKKKTGDGGVDGFFPFRLENEKESRTCILEVKGGKNLNISQVRAFIKTCQEKEKQVGILVTMGHITDGMKKECYEVGKIKDVQKCDIVSVADLMNNKKPNILHYNIMSARAPQML